MQLMSGVANPTRRDTPPGQWVLHLKRTTPMCMDAVLAMHTSTTRSKQALRDAMRFMDPQYFRSMRCSGKLKPSRLTQRDVDKAVEWGKFELCSGATNPLPDHMHGVNVFAIPEMKGRRRIITEPMVNSQINKDTLPRLEYPGRLERRQALRYCRYMLQIDFEAYYDSIPIPESIRNHFVFLSRNGKFYRCRTLPTGARWSVGIGQLATSVIVDIDTPVFIFTMIDNILFAAHEGQEAAFLKAIRSVLDRIRSANLLTSPDRETLASMSDEKLIAMSLENNVFLGEEYMWTGSERIVRNSIKTMAKLKLSLQKELYTCRTFVSLVSLILYALHTTQLNPASSFALLRAYRGVYREVTRGYDWDSELPYLDPEVRQNLLTLGTALLKNEWWQVADERTFSYNENDYDAIIFTDASAKGWGAIVHWTTTGKHVSYQRRWERRKESIVYRREKEKYWSFATRFSADAEPRAAMHILRELMHTGELRDGMRVALVTDHVAIPQAQRRRNGFSGIGRGYSLNRLYEYTHAMRFDYKVDVLFFYVAWQLNPADRLSRHFGGHRDDCTLVRGEWNHQALPLLSSTRCPVID